MSEEHNEPTQRRTSAKGERRRQQILDRAIELFAERGVDGASLRSLADAIGVSHTALRHYFDSRDDLLIAVYREHEARAMAVVGPDESEGDPVTAMIGSADRNRTVPGLVQLYITLSTDALQEQHPSTREFVRGRFAEIRRELAARVVQGQRAGTIDPDLDPNDVASLVIAASDGLQVQWLLDPRAVDVGRTLALLARILPPRRA